MRSVSIEYYPDLKNVSAYVGSDLVFSATKHQFDGWVILRRRLQLPGEESLLSKAVARALAKLRKIMEEEKDNGE